MSVTIEPIEPENIPSDSEPNTDAPKKRRGRPPGTTTGTRRTSAKSKADVESAVATMGTVYSALSAGLLLANKPGTAEMFAGRIDQTQKANREAFEASPALAQAIARLGQVSSIGLFIGANLSLIGATLITFRLEGAHQRAARAAENENNEQDRPTGDFL